MRTAKYEFSQRLGADWQDLVDVLGLPEVAEARFRPGAEAREIWNLLKRQGRLHDLPGALRQVGRSDLANVIEPGIAALGQHESEPSSTPVGNRNDGLDLRIMRTTRAIASMGITAAFLLLTATLIDSAVDSPTVREQWQSRPSTLPVISPVLIPSEGPSRPSVTPATKQSPESTNGTARITIATPATNSTVPRIVTLSGTVTDAAADSAIWTAVVTNDGRMFFGPACAVATRPSDTTWIGPQLYAGTAGTEDIGTTFHLVAILTTASDNRRIAAACRSHNGVTADSLAIAPVATDSVDLVRI